jgi:hypothetical protein
MKLSNSTLKILFFSTFFGFILRGPLSAQVTVNVVVNPPFTQFAEAYFSPQKSTITLINGVTGGGVARDVKIRFSLLNTLNQGLKSKANFTPARPIRLGIGEARVMSAADFEGIFRRANFDVIGLTQTEQDQLLRDRLIPEGFYQLCIQVLDFNTNAVLSDEVCYDFNIQGIDPPQIINFTTLAKTYQCGDVVAPMAPLMWSTMWTPPVVIGGGAISYTFEMYQVPLNIDPQQFIAAGNAQPFFKKENLFSPLLQLLPGDVQFNAGTTYAYRIRAIDQTGETAFRNGGWSAVCSFTYGQAQVNGQGQVAGNAYYPNDVDLWVPFEKVPFIVQVNSQTPFNNFKHFTTQLKLSKADANCDNAEFQGAPITKNWLNGGLAGRRDETNNQNLSENLARYIPTNANFENLGLQRGASYYWCADIGLGTKVGEVTSQSSAARGRFKFGIGPSMLNKPTNGEKVAKGAVKLMWQTAGFAGALFPSEYKVVQQGAAALGDDFTNGKVHEKWVLDVSTKADFADFVTQKSGEINSVGFGSETKANIIAALYKNLEETIQIPADGKYYWRLRWLTDPNSANLNSSSYAQSAVLNFTVGNGGGGNGGGNNNGQPADPQVEPIVKCSESCTITLDDLVAVELDPSVYKVNESINQKIQIGQFELMVTKVTGIDNKLKMSGQGRITVFSLFGVPAFPLLVDFTNVQLNKNKQVVSGYARAQNQPEAALLPYVKTDGMLDGLKMFKIGDNIGDYFSNSADQLIGNASSNVRQSGFKLPFGHKFGRDESVLLAVNRFRFFPKSAYMGAVVEVNLPDANPKVISLGVDDVCIGSNGLCSSFRVFLNKDLDVELGGKEHLVFEAYKGAATPNDPATGTYALITEGDFDSLRVQGYYQFSTNTFVSAADKVSPVKARVTFTTKRFSEFIAEFKMESFIVKENPDWVFLQPKSAYWDHDTKRNPLNLPKVEGKPALQSDVTWFGFIIPEMELQTPRIIKDAANNTYPNIKIKNFIIDDKGLSGDALATNILPLSNGAIANWGASIDTFFFAMFDSKFIKAGMRGGIVLPVSNLKNSGKRAQLDYFCNLTNYEKKAAAPDAQNGQNNPPPNNPPPNGQNPPAKEGLSFEFQVLPKGDLAFDIYAGVGNIKESSRILIKAGAGESFKLQAILNGSLDIKHDFGGVVGNVDFAEIKFEGFGLSDEGVEQGSWAIASPQKKAAGFPLSIKKVQPVIRNQSGGYDLGISFDLNFVLTDDTAKQVFSAMSNMEFFGEIRRDNNGRLQPDRIGARLNKVQVEGDLKAVKFKGELEVYRGDAKYGDGFKGAVTAVFPEAKIGAAATLQVGKVNNYNYWFVDAMVSFGEGGMAFIPPLQMYGLGGGAYYHMRQSVAGQGLTSIALTSVDSVGGNMDKFKKVGQTPSGITYIPDAGVPLGLKAKMEVGVPGKIFEGNVQLALEFNENYGLNRFAIDGEGIFIKTSGQGSGIAKGEVHILFNFEQKTFDLHADATAKITAGTFTVNARIPMHMYVDAKPATPDWFIKVGTPDGTAGQAEQGGGVKSGPITVSAEVLGIRFANFMAYFETGNFALDAIPPIDPWVENILRNANVDVSIFKQDFANSGKGVRLGAKFGIDIKQKVAIFEGALGLHAGFDLAFDHFDTDCDGVKSNNPIGIDGWYAQGQIYAGIYAKLSINIDLFLVSGDFVIFEAQAAAVLKGGLPNPVWFKGAIGGRYEILDGLVEGSFHYNFSIGKQCSPAGDPFGQIKLIADSYPNDANKTKVPADLVPTVAFNAKIDKEYTFTLNDKNGNDVVRRFRSASSLIVATLTDNSGSAIALNGNVSQDKYSMFFLPQSGLNASKTYSFTVKARLEELIGGAYDKVAKVFSGGNWETAIKDGKPFEETWSVGGITLEPLKEIPQVAIKYTYPFYYQRFYMPQECTQLTDGVTNQAGRIELTQSLAAGGFSSSNEFGSAEIRVVPVLPLNNGQAPLITRIPFDANDAWKSRLAFALPTMVPEGIYMAEMVLMPKVLAFDFATKSVGQMARFVNNAVQAQSVNIYKKTNTSPNILDTSSANIVQRTVTDRLRLGTGEKRIATIFFKVSNHKTFAEKANLFKFQGVEYTLEARYSVQGTYYSKGRWTYYTTTVRKEVDVRLDENEVKRTNVVGLKRVLADKINAGGMLPSTVAEGNLYVLGMKRIDFNGGECFDDYDILGYNKSNKIDNRLVAVMPPLVHLENKSAGTWVDNMLTSLTTTYGLSFSKTSTLTMLDPDNGSTLKVEGKLDRMRAKLLPKMSPNEAIGASEAYDCSLGTLSEWPCYKGIPVADVNNTVEISRDEVGSIITSNYYENDGNTPTIRLEYQLLRMSLPRQANIVVAGAGSSNGGLYSNLNLGLVGRVYNVASQSANNASVPGGQMQIGYQPPGGCPPITTNLVKIGN